MKCGENQEPVQPLRTLTRYTAWANDLLYESLREQPPAMLASAKPGRERGILGVLGHILVVGLIWKAHLMGQEHGFTTRQLEEDVPLPDLRRRQAALDAWYVEFTDGQSPASLAEDVRFRFVDGGAGVMRRDEILMHVVNHATYHRGYVADMLYDSGSKPPTMDLPVYVRAVRAAVRTQP